MSNLVPNDQIERIVGHDRHSAHHLGRAVSAERTVYILHPESCPEADGDYRLCPWSLALDNGIRIESWHGHEDHPVILSIRPDGEGVVRLVPVEIGVRLRGSA